ncbi:MAG TPA: hypothetical protein VNR87_03590 [Flavisolibacter sp.]|nr:hypothetical protein [Flavisolibacter sp.]
MIREILTLTVDEKPTQYYIQFEKNRRRFAFQPTLQNRNAPSFIIHIDGTTIRKPEGINEDLLSQAEKKVRELLSNPMFDNF